MGSSSIRSLLLAGANLLLVISLGWLIGGGLLLLWFLYKSFTATGTFEAGNVFLGTIVAIPLGLSGLLAQFIARQNATTIAPPLNAPPAVRRAVEVLDSHDPDQRKIAINTLAEMHHTAARKVLLAALKRHPAWSVRAQAASVLIAFTAKDVVPGLINGLSDSAWEVREACAGGLARIKDARATSALIQTLRGDTRSEVRIKAAYTLGELGNPKAVSALTETLKNGDLFLRRMSAVSLGKIRDVTAVPDLIAVLPIEEQEVRPAIAQALGLIGDKRAALPLVEALCKDMNSEAIFAMETALKKIGSAAVPAMLKGLNCRNRDAVRMIINIIGDVGDASVVKELLDTLRQEHNQAYRDTIINAVEKVARRADTLPTLLEALKDDTSLIRAIGIWILGRLQAVDAVPRLIELLSDTELIPPSAGWPTENRRICDITADTLEALATPEAHAAVEQWRRGQGGQQA